MMITVIGISEALEFHIYPVYREIEKYRRSKSEISYSGVFTEGHTKTNFYFNSFSLLEN